MAGQGPSTKTPSSMARRRSLVYVDVPPSPYPISKASRRVSSAATTSPLSGSRKENHPFQPQRQNPNAAETPIKSAMGTASRKRKAIDDGNIIPLPLSKKSKLSTPLSAKSKSGLIMEVYIPARQPQTPVEEKTAKAIKPVKPAKKVNPAEEGYINCHQCQKKQDPSSMVQCTLFRDVAKRRRCLGRYCRACLQKRYDEDLDAIIARSKTLSTNDQQSNHIADAPYYFRCYHCTGQCNCRICMKKRGLEPIGNLKTFMQNARVDLTKISITDAIKAHAVPLDPLKAERPTECKPPKPLQIAAKPSAAAPPKSKVAPLQKPKVVPPPKPKPLPRPTWTTLSVPLRPPELEIRMHLREFILRFGSVLQIAATHLEELDRLVGETVGDHDDDTESPALVLWIGEPALKAIVLSLLDAFAKACTVQEQIANLKVATMSIRGSGANLNKIWAALAALRLSNARCSAPNVLAISYPDPLPPPPSAAFRSLRHNARAGDDALQVGYTAQLVPVVAGLVESVMVTPLIRQEIEDGADAEKELAKEVKETITVQNSKFSDIKEALTATDKAELKEKRAKHKAKLQDLEFAHRMALHQYIPRFGAELGRDSEGRVYYALSPGVGEREAAERTLEGKEARTKFGKRRAIFDEEDRKEMQRWSWFVAVWGRKPEGALEAKSDDDDNPDRNPSDESWWGFWEPQEITKLSEWLAVKSGVTSDAPSPSGQNVRDIAGSSYAASSSTFSHGTSNDEVFRVRPKPTDREMQGLVKKLAAYAELLQWRVQRVSSQEK